MKARARSLLLLSGAVLLLYSPLVVGRVFVPQDFLTLIYPWKAAAVEVGAQNPDLLDIPTFFFPIDCFINKSLKQGDVPLWDPQIFLGHPIFANGQSALFYPPKLLLHRIFAPEIARSLSIFLHTLAAVILMFLFLELRGFRPQASRLGAVVWALNAHVASWAVFDHIMIMATHVPLMLWSFENGRRGRLWGWPLLGVAGAACLHSGHLQIAFYSGVILMAYALFSFCSRPVLSHFLAILGSGVLVVLLSAPTLLPFLELLGNSARRDWQWEQIQGMSSSLPALLATMIHPDILGNPTTGFMVNRVPTNLIFSEFATYFGALPLLLVLGLGWRPNSCLSKKETIYWWGFGLLMLLFACASPLYWVFTKVMTPLAKAIPGRSLLAFCFCPALLSASALHNYLEDEDDSSRPGGGAAVAGLLALLVCGWLSVAAMLTVAPNTVLGWLRPYFGPAHLKLPPYDPDPTLYQTALLDGLWNNYVLNPQLAAVVLGLAFLLWTGRRWSKENLAGAVVVITFFELALFFWGYTPTAPRDRVLPTTPAIEMLQEQEGHFRIEKYSAGFYDLLTPYGLSVVTGYDSVIQAPVFEAFRLTDPEKVVNQRFIALRDFHHPFFDHAGLKFLMVGPKTPSIPQDWTRAFEQEVTLYENPSTLPRVYLAHQVEVIEELQPTIERLAAPDFEAGRRVILREPLETDLGQGRAEISSYTPDRVTVNVESEGRAVLVLNDAHYQGWRATVAGRPTTIHRANGVFRAVAVPDGESVVEFSFEPDSLARALRMATAGLVLALLWLTLGLVRKPVL